MLDIPFFNIPEGRYTRHSQIQWWDQQKISESTIIVAGVGALGNEVLKLLALIGIGHLVIIDYDVIEISNLSRTILFRESDIGKYKVDVAEQRIIDLNPEIRVKAIKGDLRYSIGLGEFRAADLVIGCLDSVNARWALNRKCIKAGREWIDGGISDIHGMVTRYSPHAGACYECNFTSKTYERFNNRYSCPFGLPKNGDEQKVPTTAVTASVIASIQVQQALMVLHKLDEGLSPGERVSLYIKPFNLLKDKLPINKKCGAHFVLPKDIPTIPYEENIEINQVITLGQKGFPEITAVELPYDFVIGFTCQNCGNSQSVLKPKELVHQVDAMCPKCGQLRTPEIITTILQNSKHSHLTLSELMIPHREIVELLGSSQSKYIQLGV